MLSLPPSPVVAARQAWRAVPRAVLLYALAIVAPTLVLLYLGLASVQRQHEAIATLTATTQRLRLERLAEALERRTADLARTCVLDPAVAAALRHVDWTPPEQAHAGRAALRRACAAHPVCADLLVLEGTELRVPRLEEPLPRTAASGPASGPRRSVEALLAEAERAEQVGAGRVAVTRYERLTAAAGDDAPWRLLGLARTARTYASLGASAAARRAWGQVARDHHDLYDAAQRPYAVVAALELSRHAGGSSAADTRAARALVDRTRHELAAGRWLISPGQAAYFSRELDAALEAPLRWAASPLMVAFERARHVRDHLVSAGLPPRGVVRPLAVSRGEPPEQLFVASVHDAGATTLGVALAVDLDHVRDRLLPELLQSLPADDPLRHTRLVPAADGSMFRIVFPFWTLSPRHPSGGGPGVSTALLAYGGAMTGVLAVLSLGVVLLVRDGVRSAATSRLRTELVSGVSHELKTPLSVIHLYAESLSDELPPGDPRAAHSRVILYESERLGHLVERVLASSRLEDGTRTLRPELHDMTTLAERFVARYRAYVAHLGFAMRVEAAAEVPPVRVDAEAFAQMLVNLVDNAVKYSGEARDLVIRVARPDAAHVAVDVEDGGLGIAASDRPRVFEPFYRGLRTGGRGGYGLGLHLVAHLMAAHGGAVTLVDTDRPGTCVRLTFPVSAELE